MDCVDLSWQNEENCWNVPRGTLWKSCTRFECGRYFRGGDRNTVENRGTKLVNGGELAKLFIILVIGGNPPTSADIWPIKPEDIGTYRRLAAHLGNNPGQGVARPE